VTNLDQTGLLLSKIADAIERTGQVMTAAAKTPTVDNRTRDHAQGMADLAYAAASYIYEIAVAAPPDRGQIADYLIILPDPDQHGEHNTTLDQEGLRARD
jgi:hypothetical protein